MYFAFISPARKPSSACSVMNMKIRLELPLPDRPSELRRPW
jgi:hypothetical protein